MKPTISILPGALCLLILIFLSPSPSLAIIKPAPAPAPAAPPPPKDPPKPPTAPTSRDQIGLTSDPRLPYDPKANPLFEMLKDLGEESPANAALHRLLYDPELGPLIGKWMEDRQAWMDLKEAYEASVKARGDKGQAARDLKKHAEDLKRSANVAEETGSPSSAKGLRQASQQIFEQAEKLELEAQPPPKAERDRIRGEIKDAKKAQDESGKKLDKSIRDLVERAEKELDAPRPEQSRVEFPQ